MDTVSVMVMHKYLTDIKLEIGESLLEQKTLNRMVKDTPFNTFYSNSEYQVRGANNNVSNISFC